MSASRRSSLILGVLAMLGVEFFLLVSVVLQFVRGDYDWIATPLSSYLLGPYSLWLIIGYFTLAAAIMLLAVGLYRELNPSPWNQVPLALFSVGAVAVCVVSLVPSDSRREFTLHGKLHLLAAGIAFLAVTVAMLIQAWRFRYDPGWRARFLRSFTLAVVAFAGLWIYALFPQLPHGSTEKAVILLIVLWLMQAARWLMLRSFAPSPAKPYHRHHNDID